MCAGARAHVHAHSCRMPGAMHFTGPEGHHHLFDTIKNLVLLLWKLLEIKFHCACVVQVHAGKWSDGCGIIDREASACALQRFHFIVLGPGRHSLRQ